VISAIAEDEEGFIWLAVENHGLVKFDPRNEEFFPPPSALSKYKDITSIYRGPTGNFWMGTSRGIVYFHPQKTTMRPYSGSLPSGSSLPDQHVISIKGDGRGNIWVATAKGVSIGTVSGDSLTGLINYVQDNNFGLSGEMVYDVVQDKSGKVWIATSNGLNILNASTQRIDTYFHDDSDPSSIADNVCYGVFEDRQGILWIATRGGLSKYDAGKFPFVLLNSSTGFPASSVTAVKSDRYGTVWIGTNSGLIRRDNESEEYEDVDIFSSRGMLGDLGKISAIVEDKGGWLWIGADNALVHYNKSSSVDVMDEPALRKGILSLTIDNNELWIGTTQGLFKHSDKTHSVTHELSAMVNEPVQTLLKDRTDELWIGTDRRLIRMLKVSQGEPTIKTYTHTVDDPSTLSHNDVTCIYESKDGKIWVGTNGGGLNYFNKSTDSFTSFTWDDGLPSDNIRGIEGDAKGNLWVTTDKGICRFDPLRRLFTNFDRNDGLQSNVFHSGAIARTNRGEIFFGGIKGMNAIYADSVTTSLAAPKILINDFQIRYKSVKPGGRKLPRHISETEEIKLTHKDNVITFGFVSVNHRDPAKDRYAFKLENFEADWNYRTAERREATYTHLPPGKYTFMVKCMNTDGIWSQEAAINVIITAPFYRTWWFYAICIAFLGFAVYAYHVKKSNEIEYVRSVMEQQIVRRTNELRKEKERVERLTREVESLQKQARVKEKLDD
jgi:ligand-binding sensor domain-containing protein